MEALCVAAALALTAPQARAEYRVVLVQIEGDKVSVHWTSRRTG